MRKTALNQIVLVYEGRKHTDAVNCNTEVLQDVARLLQRQVRLGMRWQAAARTVERACGPKGRQVSDCLQLNVTYILPLAPL